MAVRTRTQKKRGGAASARKKGSAAAAKKKPRVAILMGSASDGPSMQAAADVLEELGVGCDVRVISAHRTPERHTRYVKSADRRGIEIFICGAGFAAHLAGVTAALTPLPVLGVPLPFMSAGGSALISSMLAVGVVLSFARRRPDAAESSRAPRRSTPGVPRT